MRLLSFNSIKSKFASKMKTLKASKIIKTNDSHAVRLASELLRSGQVIAVPSDTIYGLACSANDADAIKKLYEIKGRNEEKPVAIVRNLSLFLKRKSEYFFNFSALVITLI